MDSKSSLREQLQIKRQSMSPSVRLEAAQAFANHFADHPYLTYAASFAAYAAMRAEAEPLPIFNRMSKFGKRSALPRIEADGLLSFREWAPGTALEEGLHGTRQPPASAESFVPEVVLVPLLGFDARGHRLGYGGGYYDRTIAHLRSTCDKPPLFVGLAFAQQEVPELPVEPHDVKLDGVLTEEGASFF